LPIDEGAGPVKSAIFGYNASCLFNLELHAGAGWRGDAIRAQAGLRERRDRGDPIGEYFLAFSLLEGRGIAKDRARAIELLRHATNRGYPRFATDCGPLPLLRSVTCDAKILEPRSQSAKSG